MPAYLVVTRERTTNPAELEEYGKLAIQTVEGHNLAIRALHGKLDILEGGSIESAVILEFPTVEEAKGWYNSEKYAKARVHRLAGGIHGAYIIEGV